MSIEELANILVQMCDNAEQDKEKSVMPHLFGIRYADEIRNMYKEIVTEANRLDERVNLTYEKEVYKGVRLAKYVIDRQSLIDFINKCHEPVFKDGDELK
ncbi:MAG: hypothetical protein LBC52_05310 [Treponema sp.]|jgi:hypothetical protein|nr:hypothetical protein [Treponema sp.]